MRELLFKRSDPKAPYDQQEFYELILEYIPDRPRPYSIRQTHYEWDGEVSPTDHIIDLFKTPEEAVDRYLMRRQTLVEIGFTESSLGPMT